MYRLYWKMTIVIFQYNLYIFAIYGHFLFNLYIFGIHLWTMLYPKLCYNEPCYKEVVMYYWIFRLCNVWMRWANEASDMCTKRRLRSICTVSSVFTVYLKNLECLAIQWVPSEDWSDYANALADPNLHWAQMSEDIVPHVAQILGVWIPLSQIIWAQLFKANDIIS